MVKYFKKLFQLGLGDSVPDNFHKFKVKVTNVIATVTIFTFYVPFFVSLRFLGNEYGGSILTIVGIYACLLCSLMILYLNANRKYKIARYILTVGFSISLFLANLFVPGFQKVFSPYVLVALGCGGIFETNRDKLLSLAICILCLTVAVLHSYDILSFSITPSYVYSPSYELVFYRYTIVVVLSFYFLHLTSSNILRIEKTLTEQLDKVENLEAQRRNYFSNTAHELKTPLTLITGHIDFLLKNYSHEKEVVKGLENVQKNTQKLMDFTGQVLDVIKKDKSGLPVNIVQFHLNELIDEALTSFDIAALNRKIDFQKPVFVPNIKIVSDAQKLLIVLNNLLSNAFKFVSVNGLITVSLTELEESIQIIVQDNGRGIKKEDLEKIFEPYFQTSFVDAPLLGGTGIGLAICKEYLNLLGGSVSVQSKWGVGSSFIATFPKRLPVDNQTFVLPYSFDQGTPHPQEAIPVKSIAQYNAAESKHLLIVEDNLELCDFLKTILGNQFNLDFAYNGVEALTFLKDSQPDLIVSDVMMPNMDGMELLSHLKNDDELRGIPVLMLTAMADSSAQSKALRIGVDDYLLKPFDSELLIAHIKNLLELAEKRIKNKYRNADTDSPFTEAAVTTEQDEAVKDAAAVDVFSNQPTLSFEDQKWLAEFEEVVINSIEDINLDLGRIANELAISKTHLNRRVNAVLGISPKRYITEVRLNMAKKMLENREHRSVKAVAYSVGYKSEKVFSKNFKVRFGCYPSQYLRK